MLWPARAWSCSQNNTSREVPKVLWRVLDHHYSIPTGSTGTSRRSRKQETVQRTDDAGLRPLTSPLFHLLCDCYWLATCCILHHSCIRLPRDETRIPVGYLHSVYLIWNIPLLEGRATWCSVVVVHACIHDGLVTVVQSTGQEQSPLLEWSRGVLCSAVDAGSKSLLSGIGDDQQRQMLDKREPDSLFGCNDLMKVDCSSYNKWTWPQAWFLLLL